MDFTVSSSTPQTPSAFPVWGLAVVSGIVPFITGNAADVQAAAMAAYLQLGSIPQLPTVGVPWVEFLTHQASFGDLDAAIRQAAANGGVANFTPRYDIQDGKLAVTMTETLQAVST